MKKSTTTTMKDQINRIITKHVHTYCQNDINYHSVQGVVPAADELTALMCYREVRAYCYGKNIRWDVGINGFVERYIIHQFKDDYTPETICQAIEQVKQEMK